MMLRPKQKNVKKIIIASLGALVIGLSLLLDKIIINLVNAIQYPLLFTFFYTITLLGETYIFAGIAIILTAVLMTRRKPITAFVLTIITSGIVQVLLKLIIDRPRSLGSLVITKMSSFPSGHTMMFFAIIPIMSKNFPKIKITLWTIAILVGISRIYLGAHYFSDVIAGAIIGYGVGWMCMKIGEKYAWKY